MRVLLVPNATNPAAVSMVVEIATWLASQDIEPVLEMSDAAACGLVDFGVERFEIREPELVVTFGGDGTILKAVHLIGEFEAPILGINMGRLGFLTAVGPEGTRDALASALAGDVRLERRATLRVRITTEDGVRNVRAFNEVFVGRSDHARMVRMSLAIDDVRVARFGADGIIVATATGSTAYAMSAGGPIVAPGFAGMVVVPVAPHTLNSRPMLTDPADAVRIELDPIKPEACVTVDGAAVPCEHPIGSVEVTRGDTDVLLVRLDGDRFYRAVTATFFGG